MFCTCFSIMHLVSYYRWPDMNERISYLLSYTLLAIFFIISVNYVEDANERASSVLHYIPRASACQYLLPVSENNGSVTGEPCTYSDVVDLRVIVITFNRPDSLSKLLRSLDTLVLDGDRAALEIWIDRDRKNAVHERTVEVASASSWTAGPTRVHVQV